MTSPNATSARVTMMRRRESSSRRSIRRTLSPARTRLLGPGWTVSIVESVWLRLAPGQGAERVAAVVEVRELVVARAGGAQQDHVARLGELLGVRNRRDECPVDVAGDDVTDPRRLCPDQMDRAHVRADRSREGREVLALRRAAEDQMNGLAGIRSKAAQGCGDVRRLAVVDVADAVPLGDELEPVRDAGERSQRLGDRVVTEAGGTRGGGGGRGVLPVVRTADQWLRRQRIVRRELDSLEPGAARDDLGSRALEDSQLRDPVLGEARVAVEMGGLEAEQHCDVAGELVHV